MAVPRLAAFILFFSSLFATAQPPRTIHWSPDGASIYEVKDKEIIQRDPSTGKSTTVLTTKQLTPSGLSEPLFIRNFFFSNDNRKILIYTNSQRVWRYDTRGDYWLFNKTANTLKKLGVGRSPASLMFAKFSPDGTMVAYVSNYNLYVEDLATGKIRPLTTGGSPDLINGTFDWAYEEEFFCRDGFRWSPDSKKIAYWQMNAKNTKDYLMVNNTDSIYPFVTPVIYPVAGEPPSPFKIGVVDVVTAKTRWMSIPTDPKLQSYLPRMEWAANNNELIVQHLNRRQNATELMFCNITTGASKAFYSETDAAWLDVLQLWDEDYSYGGWDWLNNGKEFLWASEKDGWRHLYRIDRAGNARLVTAGDYDVMKISAIDEDNNYVYFEASPNNATQMYLYRTKLDGSGNAERVSPANQNGTHEYDVSPTAKLAFHTFSNYYTPNAQEWVSLPSHKSLTGTPVDKAIASFDSTKSLLRFLKVKSSEGVEMDAWMVKPRNFDPSKKYPVVFYVYTEPAAQTVQDQFGEGGNFLYNDLVDDGYIYVSIDNRGTPLAKGRAWRKSIYRKIGLVNIRDQALGAKEILKLPFIDTSRTAVWGWSGGGSATLNLMFQYPEIYKTGIAIAAVGNMLTYDNIYQERYMGLPQENREDFLKGSPINYAKNLRGNLLYVHGTGDDNVHYQNAELLLNELIRYDKQFQFMAYPNRSHGIFEGAGTREHLKALFKDYLRQHCPPGGR